MTELINEIVQALIDKFDHWRSIHNIHQSFEYTINYIIDRGNDEYQTNINLYHHQEKIITNNLEFIESNINKWLPNIEVNNIEVKNNDDHIIISVIIRRKPFELIKSRRFGKTQRSNVSERKEITFFDKVGLDSKLCWECSFQIYYTPNNHWTNRVCEDCKNVLYDELEKANLKGALRSCHIQMPALENSQTIFIEDINYEVKFVKNIDSFVWLNPILFCKQRRVPINQFRKELARQMNCPVALRESKFIFITEINIETFIDFLKFYHDYLTLTPGSERAYRLEQEYESMKKNYNLK